jgi:hypothetical protein
MAPWNRNRVRRERRGEAEPGGNGSISFFEKCGPQKKNPSM